MEVEKLVEKIILRKKFKKLVKTYDDSMLDAIYSSAYDSSFDYEVVEISGQLWKHFTVKTDGGRLRCNDELENTKNELSRHFVLNRMKCHSRWFDDHWVYDIVYRNRV